MQPESSERDWLVVYDIADDGLRGQVSKLLSGWGERVQFSVFDCRLDDAERRRLVRQLQALLGQPGTPAEGMVDVRLFPLWARGQVGAPDAGRSRGFWLA